MVTNRRIGFRGLPRISHSRFQIREFRSPPAGMRPARAREARCCTTRPRAYRSHTKTKRAEQRSALPVRRNRAAHDLKGGQPRECIRTEQGSVLQCRAEAVRLNRPGRYSNSNVVPFPVSWTVKMKKKQKETQDILSYHSQAAGCSDKARAKASGGRQPIEECGRTGL